MTQAIRDAAQALLDAYAENGPYRHLHISTARVALQDAMTSPQPTADERVEHLIELFESYGEACAAEQRAKYRGEHESHAVHTRHDLPAMLGAVEQSARALLSVAQEDADMLDWLDDNEHLFNWGALKYMGLRAAIRSAMGAKETK